ncbi:DUF1870 family protein [Candidatus Symbiopectobacterium sp.]
MNPLELQALHQLFFMSVDKAATYIANGTESET